MKKQRKLNLKKINVANFNTAKILIGGINDGPLKTINDCPITRNACNTTIVMGSVEADCVHSSACLDSFLDCLEGSCA